MANTILLAKLKSYGVTGKLQSWFANYINGRLQRVVVNGVASQWTSGVPQGNILGPMHFTIFINDLPNFVTDESLTALYADDSKVYENISSIQCCESLQQSLDCLSCWNYIDNMSFNASNVKCHLNYATEVWSPAYISLKCKIENVQRRASRWILQQRKGQEEYKDQLVALDLLPLRYYS